MSMRHVKMVATVALGLSTVLPASSVSAQDTKAASKAPATVSAPVYKPPMRGTPAGRVGGGTRGAGREFVLSALAPDHSGLTLREQPSLYWFISDQTTLPVELTVIDPRTNRPVLETRLPSPVTAGIHVVRLADFGIRLAPGVTYQWFIAVIPDAARRSRDILAGGSIERIEPPQALPVKLGQATKDELPAIYAEAGIWYDALASISELIDAAPSDQALRRQRAALISQIGLSGVAEH